MLRLRFVPVLFSCIVISACGGGGGASSAPPGPAPTVPTQTGNQASGKVTLTFDNSNTSVDGLEHNSGHLSGNAQVFSVLVNGNVAPAIARPACPAACSMTLDAPAGADALTVKLQDIGGFDVSVATANLQVPAGGALTAAVAFQGVVRSVALSVANPNPTQGAASSQPLRVLAKDMDGVPITDSAGFYQPITLTSTDSSGGVQLSRNTVAAAGDVVTVAYSGAFASATISGSVPTLRKELSADAVITPALRESHVMLTGTESVRSGPFALAADGSAWIETNKGLAHYANGAMSELTYPGTFNGDGAIAIGQDGTIWYGGAALNNAQWNGAIGRYKSGTHQLSWLPSGGDWSPLNLAAAPDGNVWFTARPGLGYVQADGSVQQVAAAAADGSGDSNWSTIGTGPDGALWVSSGRGFSRINADKSLTLYAEPLARAAFAVGPDRNFWFLDGTTVNVFDGSIHAVAAHSFNAQTSSVVSAGGAVWIAGSVDVHGRPQVWRVAMDGTTTALVLPLPNAQGPYAPVVTALAPVTGGIAYAVGNAIGTIQY